MHAASCDAAITRIQVLFSEWLTCWSAKNSTSQIASLNKLQRFAADDRPTLVLDKRKRLTQWYCMNACRPNMELSYDNRKIFCKSGALCNFFGLCSFCPYVYPQPIKLYPFSPDSDCRNCHNLQPHYMWKNIIYMYFKMVAKSCFAQHGRPYVTTMAKYNGRSNVRDRQADRHRVKLSYCISYSGNAADTHAAIHG